MEKGKREKEKEKKMPLDIPLTQAFVKNDAMIRVQLFLENVAFKEFFDKLDAVEEKIKLGDVLLDPNNPGFELEQDCMDDSEIEAGKKESLLLVQNSREKMMDILQIVARRCRDEGLIDYEAANDPAIIPCKPKDMARVMDTVVSELRGGKHG